MPDIAMCYGDDCPQKNQCYRHRAIPSQFRQSFMTTPPHSGGECDHFWPIEDFPDDMLESMDDEEPDTKN